MNKNKKRGSKKLREKDKVQNRKKEIKKREKEKESLTWPES